MVPVQSQTQIMGMPQTCGGAIMMPRQAAHSPKPTPRYSSALRVSAAAAPIQIAQAFSPQPTPRTVQPTPRSGLGRSNSVTVISHSVAIPSSSRRSKVDDESYGEGVEVQVGEHRFRCSAVLGRGSYGEVWRAQVLAGPAGLSEVALKEVNCRSQSELQQAIFEVQVLLALERAAAPCPDSLRVPRCICYQVDPSSKGWKVRTAMTVVPGESLDYFVRHKPLPGRTILPALKRGMVLVAKLFRDIGPSLQLLGPIAWHRDVNSHNILVHGAPEDADAETLAETAAFWLIDFGLAVDSQSWVSDSGKWRTEYIGGDSRYWPPSSWIMHLLGPEGFNGHADLCEQYQRRLDVHGLGITALELLCSLALSCPLGSDEQLGPWAAVLDCWRRYRDDVWRWWAAVYAVFSTGGDLAPVQAQLVEDQIVSQLLQLLAEIRSALRTCADHLSDTMESKLLCMMADMLDESKDFDLAEIQRLLGGKAETDSSTPASPATPASPTSPTSATSPDGPRRISSARSAKILHKTEPPASPAANENSSSSKRSFSTPSNGHQPATATSPLVQIRVVGQRQTTFNGPPPLQSQPEGRYPATADNAMPWNGVNLPAMMLKAENISQADKEGAPSGQQDPLSRTMRKSPSAAAAASHRASLAPRLRETRDAIMSRVVRMQAKCKSRDRLHAQVSELEERLLQLQQGVFQRAKVKIAQHPMSISVH